MQIVLQTVCERFAVYSLFSMHFETMCANGLQTGRKLSIVYVCLQLTNFFQAVCKLFRNNREGYKFFVVLSP